MADYTLLAKIMADSSGFEKGVNAAESALGGLEKTFSSLGGLSSSVGSAFSSIGSVMAPVTAGMTALGVASAKTTVDFMKVYQASMTTFKQFYGGEEAARSLYNSLYEIASASTFSQEAFLTSAQTMAGMGVSAENVTRYMQVAADAVSAMGGSSADLEDLAGIFGKITTQGKITGENLNEFAYRGVNALEMLAEQYGVTTEEMQKMVSDGLVTSEEGLAKLSTALEDTSNGYAGMAKAIKSGSIAGALDSLNSAFRTFSLNLTGINPTIGATDEALAQADQRSLQLANGIGAINKIIPVMSGLFTSVTDGIGSFLDILVGTEPILNDMGDTIGYTGGVLTELANAFGSLKTAGDSVSLEPLKATLDELAQKFPFLQGLVDGFFRVFDSNGDMVLTFEEMKTALQGIGDTILKVAATGATFMGLGLVFSKVGGILSGLGGVFGSLNGIVSGAGGAITGLAGKFTALSAAGSGMHTSMFGLQGVMGMLTSPIGLIIAGVVALIAAFAYLFTTNEEFRNSIMGIVDSLMSTLQPAIDQIMAAFQTFAEAMMPVIETLLNALIPVFISVAEVIAQVLAAIVPIIAMIISTVLPIISQIMETLAPLIAQLMGTLVPVIEMIGQIIAKVMPTILNIIQSVLNVIMGIWNAVWPAISTVIEVVFAIIEGVINTVMSVIQGIIDTFTAIIQGDWEGAWEAVSTMFSNIWDGIVSTVETIASTVQEGFQDAIDFITGLPEKALQWGADIINSIVEGIQGAIGGIADAASGIGDTIASFLGFSEPEVGPLSNFHTFMPDMIDLMVKGMEDNLNRVTAAANDVASAIAQPMEGTATIGYEYAYASPMVSDEAYNAVMYENDEDLRGIAREELESANIAVVMDDGTLVGQIAPGVDREIHTRSERKKRGF